MVKLRSNLIKLGLERQLVDGPIDRTDWFNLVFKTLLSCSSLNGDIIIKYLIVKKSI